MEDSTGPSVRPNEAARPPDPLAELRAALPRRDDPDAAAAWLDRLAVRVIDAIKLGDAGVLSGLVTVLDEASPRLDPEAERRARGMLTALRSTVAPAPRPPGASFEPAALASRMLRQLLGTPQAKNRELAALLGTDETQISRAGRRLISAGLVFRVKRGRTNRWVVTDKGRLAAADVDRVDATRDLLAAIERASSELLGESDPQAARAAADELVRLGIAQRGSILTRGSLVRSATPRLSSAAESRLLALQRAAPSPLAESLLAVLGEWGSGLAARDLAGLVSVGSLGDEGHALAMVGALKKLGGSLATEALVQILETAGEAGSTFGSTVRHVLAAIEELTTGGAGDATEPADLADRSNRWQPDDPAHAQHALQRLTETLSGVAEAGPSLYARENAMKIRALLTERAYAAGFVLPHREVAGDGQRDRASAMSRPPVGGAPASTRPAGDDTYALVVDIGHWTMRVGLGNRAGAVVAVRQVAFDNPVDKEADDTIQKAARLAPEILQHAAIDAERVEALVLGVPGPISTVEGAVISLARKFPYMIDWDDFPIVERAEAAFGDALGRALRVYVENDANLGVLGEVSYGSARGCSDAIYVKVSAGIGAGLYLRGDVYRGRLGLAGEFGHSPVGDYPSDYAGFDRRSQPPQCPRCHQKGCLEVMASAQSMLDWIAETSRLRPSSPAEVVENVRVTPVYAQAVARSGTYLGVALSGLMSLLDPEVVLLSGVLSRAGAPFIDAVRHSVDERMGELANRIEVAENPELAGIVGGLSLAFLRTGRPAGR